MRTVTFSDAEVAKRVNDSCVGAWRNKRPDMKIPDGLYKGLSWSIRFSNGAAAHNLASIFAAPDGTVIHAVPGVLDAASFKENLEFARALRARMFEGAVRRKDADQICAEAHRTAGNKSEDRVLREAHKRLAAQSLNVKGFPPTFFDGMQKVYS